MCAERQRLTPTRHKADRNPALRRALTQCSPIRYAVDFLAGRSGMQFGQLKRREFITLFGSLAAVWPLAARAQQAPIPVVGVLGSGSAQFRDVFAAGLSETGYREGQNVRVEYRWAGGAYDRLSAIADELVNMRVSVIATFGSAAAPGAKAASMKVSPPIPVVFVLGSDPVAEGLVASLNRPGGNVTGSTTITGALTAKRLELLRTAVGSSAA